MSKLLIEKMVCVKVVNQPFVTYPVDFLERKAPIGCNQHYCAEDKSINIRSGR